MSVTDEDVASADRRMTALRDAGYAVAARYDRRTGRIVVSLHTGVRLTVPARLLEGLAGAGPGELGTIEISPSGLGLHWPKLDADVYVPALLGGVFGSRRWMAEIGEAAGSIAPTDDGARRRTAAS